MPTVFTKIIEGELPGRFVWRDDRCAAFLTINPIKPGHTLVVPREEIDDWLDLPADLLHHLMDVSRTIGQAISDAWQPPKVGMMIVGLEVPHVHIHLAPIEDVGDLNFANAERDPDPGGLDEAAERIRAALRERGAPHVVDA